MTKSKKAWIILLAILIPIFPLIYIVVGWTTLFAGLWIFTPTPAKPQQTYGEFPFELTYMRDGETITINDVYICEYDGIGINEGQGKYRSWKGYIKSTGEDSLILVQDGNIRLCCTVGYAEYYMDDLDYDSEERYEPVIYYLNLKNEAGGTTSSSAPEKVQPLIEKYQIEIISWTLSDPIENSFG